MSEYEHTHKDCGGEVIEHHGLGTYWWCHKCEAPVREGERVDAAQTRQDRYAFLADERANTIRLLECERDELKRERDELQATLRESVKLCQAVAYELKCPDTWEAGLEAIRELKRDTEGKG